MYHIIYEDGAWSLWYDGRIIGRYHTEVEATEAIYIHQKETA